MKFYFTTTLAALWSILKIQILIPFWNDFCYVHYVDDHDRYIHLYFNTIFTTPKSWITNNNFIIFASTFTTLWLWKQKRLYQCYYHAHYAMTVLKNKSIFIVTLLSLRIYLVVVATFTTPWSWHKIKLIFIPILFSLHNF